MKRQTHMNKKILTKSLTLSALLLGAGQASAVTYNLCTGVTNANMPDGTTVSMWAYGIDDNTPGCNSATVPGPRLDVAPGDTDLTINLRNTLPEPASIIVPGLSSSTATTPVFFTDGQGRSRARSFTHEAAPGLSASYSYVAKPGTYLYHSGTHPAVQVQMGLYGGVTQDAVTGQIYSGVTYDTEVMLIYSEIDPALHAAVSNGTYSTAAYPSTINYHPTYFLVNGQPFSATTANIAAGEVGDRILLRLLNAGLETHVPTLLGQRVDVVAEYGHVYPYARNQYSVMLAAGQTRDAIMTPLSEGTFSLFDRRLRLANSNRTTGGMLSKLVVSAAGGGGPVDAPPVATDDVVANAVEDSAINITLLSNDTDDTGLDVTTLTITTQALNGWVTVNPDGTATYTPNADFNGTDSFSYVIRDTAGQASNEATVSVTVAAVNDAPVASGDAFDVQTGAVLNGNVLANDSDVDGDALTTVLQTSTSNGSLTLNTDGSFSYTANAGFVGADSFVYVANDGIGNSNPVTVDITVTAAVNMPPVANDDYAVLSVGNGNTDSRTIVIDILANDVDADGTLDPATVNIVANPRLGRIISVNEADGTVTYRLRRRNRGFRGSDTFSYTVKDNDEETSNQATVRVDIVD